MPHPFETVSIKRISRANPRFLRNLDLSKLRRNIELERAKQELGKTANAK